MAKEHPKVHEVYKERLKTPQKTEDNKNTTPPNPNPTSPQRLQWKEELDTTYTTSTDYKGKKI